jgi:hypothetical protein
MTAGIYKITAKTGEVYVGQSSNIEQRWAQHISWMKHSEDNANKDLQRLYDEQGPSTFTFEIIEVIPDAKQYSTALLTRERWWQQQYPNCLGTEGTSVLEDDQVRAMRAMRATSKCKDVAKHFGVSHTLVSLICNHKRYTHVV